MDTVMKLTDDDFLRRVRCDLDADIEAMDGATVAQLAQIRRAAVARASVRPTFNLRFAPAVAFAASTAMLAILLRVPGGSLPPLEHDVPLIEFALADGELELIEELEFYQWLDARGYAG